MMETRNKRKRGNAGDDRIGKRLARYDRWVKQGKISYSSKVIPVQESLLTQQWVLPTAQVIEILNQSRSYALTDCECRLRYKRCSHPVEVCFLINRAADEYVAQGRAHHVSLDEAAAVLDKAKKNGLVHLTIYNPDQGAFAVCSCCPCCCHDLQFIKLWGRGDLIARSDYIAYTQPEECIQCGACVDRCVFQARVWKDSQMFYDPDSCYGCGLCVTICPSQSTSLQPRESK
jgi:NAD-dependent dihydropyrimidine dehydrogenase PreA subunit